jgi:hypothetical protein
MRLACAIPAESIFSLGLFMQIYLALCYSCTRHTQPCAITADSIVSLVLFPQTVYSLMLLLLTATSPLAVLQTAQLQ